MWAKKKKLREPTSVSEEAPLLGGFAGVFLAIEVFGATSLVVTGAGRGGVATLGFTLVLLSPKTPICICKRIAMLRRI